MKIRLFFLLALYAGQSSIAQNSLETVSIGERQIITSKVLQEDRSFQVFLPATYYSSKSGNFPVVYIMDGDYNFHYETGLINLLSHVSERIPEMIVVGISDNGSEKYKEYCTPGGQGEGSAADFRLFLESELKPHINHKYRTSPYEILIGHSLGGLFVTDYYLEEEKAFDVFIAIDPALWWNDYELVEKAERILKTRKEPEAFFYTSLSNLKGMGVMPFVGVMDKNYPDREKWHFWNFEQENHNSVGLLTLKYALERHFEEWEMSAEKFRSLGSANHFIANYVRLNEEFETSFGLPPGLLSNVVYSYRDDAAQLKDLEDGIAENFPASLDEFYFQKGVLSLEMQNFKEARQIFESQVRRNPNSYKCYDGLSKVYLAQGDFKKAKEMSLKALAIAKNNKVRQWQLNELEANRRKIEHALLAEE